MMGVSDDGNWVLNCFEIDQIFMYDLQVCICCVYEDACICMRELLFVLYCENFIFAHTYINPYIYYLVKVPNFKTFLEIFPPWPEVPCNIAHKKSFLYYTVFKNVWLESCNIFWLCHGCLYEDLQSFIEACHFFHPYLLSQ